jgi:hypothetical protein
MKKAITVYIPFLGAVILFAVGASETLQYHNHRSLESKTRALREEIQRIDALEDYSEAIAMYKKIAPSLPEVDLRILQRQWAMALELLHRIQAAKYNPELENDLQTFFGTLREHLDEMRDRCSTVLADSTSLPAAVAWQAYNIEGSVRLLMAFLSLETERNSKKVTALMREAISDFKAAIDSVDSIAAAGTKRNIPRWNMELLHAEQYVEQFQMVEPDSQKRLDLRDNLEALIPEKGGYAPGEPLERRIRK